MRMFRIKPAVHDHRRDLPPLACSGTVAEEKALTITGSILGLLERGSFLSGAG